MPTAVSTGPALHTSDLTKHYAGLVAVDGVTLELRQREILGFIGPNGAGKSTFMKMLIGIVRPTRGAGEVCGLDIRRRSTAVRRVVGYLPGDLGLYRNLRGAEFLDFMLSFHPQADAAKAQRLAERLEVPLARRIKAYSSGMKQKLGLIQALCVGAQVLILDEPTRGLDPTMQSEFLDLLAVERDAGAAILLSSHILGEMERACDRVLFIDRGRLVAAERIAAVKQAFRRRLRVSFAEDIGDGLARVPGVEVLKRRAHDTLLHLHGDLGAALAALAALGLDSIDYNRPTLEEIYRALYLTELPSRSDP